MIYEEGFDYWCNWAGWFLSGGAFVGFMLLPSNMVFGLPRNIGRLMGCLPAQVFCLTMNRSGGGRSLLPARLPWQPVVLLKANKTSCI